MTKKSEKKDKETKDSKDTEKSRRKGEIRTSMFITDKIYKECGDISERVRLPMRQIWEAGVISIKDRPGEEIEGLLQTQGIKPGWRARN